jgi:ligand-binding sensor domain-containing protein/serine phosphatase RsbU (regulator of sigma subunit)
MRYIVFVGFILLTKVFDAQIYSFTQFTKNDGLPSTYIYDIEQDDKGFLAVATGDGLCYFGGSKFMTFDTTNGIGDNIISCLGRNTRGEIVMGHMKKGLSKRSGYGFENIAGTKSIESPINCVLHLGDNILFGMRNGFLGIIENNVTKLIALPGATFINKIINANGTVLVATDNGIYKFGADRSARLIKNTEGIHFTGLANYWNKQLLAGTDSGELYIYELTASQEILKQISVTTVCKNVTIKSIINTTANRILIASWGNGIYSAEIDISGSELKNKKNIGAKNGLGSLFVNVLLKDFNDNVWIGTFGGGLYKFNNQHFKVYNQKSDLYQDRVRSVLAVENKIYLGFENGLQVLSTLNEDSLVVYNSKNKFKDVKVTTLAKIDEFNILVGTENNGLFIFDSKKQSFSEYFQKTKLKNAPRQINHLYFSKDSVVYISTLDGLYIYNIKSGKIKRLTTDEGLPHNNILSTFLDTQHRLWFVAPKSVPGLIQNDSIVLFKDIPNFSSYNTTSICEGRNGNIYITTNGDGIYKYSKGVFMQYTVKKGLLSNYVLNAVFDKNKEMLICTHQNGFSVFDLGKNKIRAVANKTSLNAFESTVNSISLENSTVYFGTEEGLGAYLIEEEKTTCLPPKNSLLKVVINKRSYNPSDSIINLPYSTYDLQFNYIGVELTYPDQVLYTYKLEGFEKNFKTTSEKRLEYNKLGEGTYTLILYSTNYLGVRNSVPLRMTIIIDKPIYKKWWFICSLILTLIAIVYFAVLIKTAQLRKQRIVLQKKIRESTEDIIRINKDLERKNLHITSSIDYAQRIQNVLLPKKEQIAKKVDAFIFYQPKDVVSGDFYWFHATQNYTYIGVVDCTGHGVPGAFMSIIGTFFLDQILAEVEDPGPSYIISELDKRIVNSLRQKDHSDGIADGMDAAICRIDSTNQQVMFCGAHRPLYFVSKGELIEVKSNRFSVGGYIEDTKRVFTDEIMNFKKGDMFYLFSDGFADQFGGVSNRRYSTKQMKNFLNKVSPKNTQQQLGEIRADFNSWKGDWDQTDDVLVLGVKL